MQSQNGCKYLFVDAAVVPAFIGRRCILPERVRANDAVLQYSMESSSLDNISHTQTQDTTLIRLAVIPLGFHQQPAAVVSRLIVNAGILGICEPISISIFQFFHFFYRNLIELIASICSADNVVEWKGKETNKCCGGMSL